MITPEQFHQLTVVEQADNGVYVSGGTSTLIFVPIAVGQAIPEQGETVEIFIYRDGKGKFKGTFRKPYALPGQVAKLEITEVTEIGAFADWGIDKDLLIPFGEQVRKLKALERPLVYVYHNKADGRIVGSTKIQRFLSKERPDYKRGDKVTIVVWGESDLGRNVIVDDKFAALIHQDDLHKSLKQGERISAFIKNVTHDDKINIQLTPVGSEGREELADKIITMLENNNGELFVTDRSSPDVIKKLFNCSKKQFKTAIGNLYKQNKIELLKTKIVLVK